MKHAMLSLDYFALAKEAKALNTSGAAKVIRIALLADCATQHLADITRAIAARNNVQAEVYEGNYDGVDLEILDPNSALYAFNPQYVVILLSSEKLKAHLYASQRPAGVRRRNNRQAGEFVGRVPGPKPGDDHSEHIRAAERASLRQLRIEGRRFRRLDLHRDQLPARRQSSRVQERPFERRRFPRRVGRPDAMVRRPDVEHGEDALPSRASSASCPIAARHCARGLRHVREMRGPRPRQHAVGRRDRRRWSRGHCARRVRRGRSVRRVPDVHSRTETARNHSRGGQQERARRRRAAVSRASAHGAEGRGYFRFRRQLGQQGRQHPAGPEDAEYRLRFARLSRRQSVRAQHRAPVPARRRRAGLARGPVPCISRPSPA